MSVSRPVNTVNQKLRKGFFRNYIQNLWWVEKGTDLDFPTLLNSPRLGSWFLRKIMNHNVLYDSAKTASMEFFYRKLLPKMLPTNQIAGFCLPILAQCSISIPPENVRKPKV